MRVSRPKFLELVQRLAFVGCTAVPGLVACTSSSPPANTGGTSAPSTTASAEPTGEIPKDPTVGSGPCRCSWETNAALAPRVCKKGEIDHEGKACIPGGDHGPGGEGGYPMPVPGPQLPPDLPA
ncbi:MAG: hypothetical protein ACXVEF_43345 [Polyangiales bacterium]